MPGTLPRAVNDASVVTPVSVTRLIQLNTEIETAAGYLFPAGVVSGALVAPTTGFAVEVGAGIFVSELVSFVLAAPQSYAGATNPSTTLRLWGKIARTAATQANRADPDTYTLSLTHTHGASYATEPAAGPWIPLADWSTDGSGISGAIANQPAGKWAGPPNRGWRSLDLAGSGDYTLTEAEARAGVLKLTGLLTGARSLILPFRAGDTRLVHNATTGAFAITAKIAGGTGEAVPQGAVSSVYCDDTDIVVV